MVCACKRPAGNQNSISGKRCCSDCRLAPTPGKGRLTHAPADHPPVKAAKIGVLLANLGTPDGYDYWSMRRYLSEFLSDKVVIKNAYMDSATGELLLETEEKEENDG